MKPVLILLILLQAVAIQDNTDILVDATADEIMEKVEAQKGVKPVLLNVWATWCAPCIEEMPYILELHEKYNDEFELILVSGDFKEAREEARQFLLDHDVDFKTYFKVGKDDEFINTISEKWTGALPFTIVYNMSGGVSAAWEGKAEMETFRKELLKVINEE